jgi:hypothetical protein
MPSTPCLTKELTFTEITASDSDGDVVAHAVQTYRLGG